ncbi:hypothetical protein Tco_0812288 [Tanacetum coccineum]
MLVDALLQHEVEGRVDTLVEEVKELESKQAELVDELVIKVAEEVAEQLQGLLPTIVAQVGDHISNQGINGSRGDNTTDDSIQEDDRNVNGGAVAYIRWVEKMEAAQDISGCEDNQKVKYSAGSLTGIALTWWNSEVRTRGRVAVERILKSKKSKNKQKPTRNEETSTRERFEANIKSRIKTVVEERQESKEKVKV